MRRRPPRLIHLSPEETAHLEYLVRGERFEADGVEAVEDAPRSGRAKRDSRAASLQTGKQGLMRAGRSTVLRRGGIVGYVAGAALMRG